MYHELDENEELVLTQPLLEHLIEELKKPSIKVPRGLSREERRKLLKRCSDTVDWVEEMTGDEYRKPKKGESY